MLLTVLQAVEQKVLFIRVLDVCLNEKTICLGVNLLDHGLERIECASLSCLDLESELRYEVFPNDAVRRGEECQDAKNKEAFVVIQLFVPVEDVTRQVKLFSRPEACLCLLVR